MINFLHIGYNTILTPHHGLEEKLVKNGVNVNV